MDKCEMLTNKSIPRAISGIPVSKYKPIATAKKPDSLFDQFDENLITMNLIQEMIRQMEAAK